MSSRPWAVFCSTMAVFIPAETTLSMIPKNICYLALFWKACWPLTYSSKISVWYMDLDREESLGLPWKPLKLCRVLWVKARMVPSEHSFTSPTASAPSSSRMQEAPTRYKFPFPSVSFSCLFNSGLNSNWAPSKTKGKFSLQRSTNITISKMKAF